jgi:hypothetical protein
MGTFCTRCGKQLELVGWRNHHCVPQPDGGLGHDEVGFQHLETDYEVLKPGAGARDGKTLTTWT